MTKICFTL